MKLLLTRLARPARTLALLLTLPGLAMAQTQPASLAQAVPPAALSALTALARAQGLSAADVADPIVTDSYFDATMGLTHTYFQQRINGLAVHNATGAVHTDKAGKVVASNQRFVAGAAASAPAPTPTLSPEEAVTAATVVLGLPRPLGLRRTVEARVADGLLFNSAGISEQDIPVRLVYARSADGQLVLTWSVTIAQLDQQHHYTVRLDARTGRLVDRSDYVVEERASFGPQAFGAQARRQALLPAATLAAAAAQLAAASQTAARAPFVLATTTATPLGAANSLTVTAAPGENPVVSPRVSVPLPGATPWSPYGWQVGQGLAPSDFFADSYSLRSSGRQLTRGNNVAAYDDNSTTTNANSLNLNLATASPDGGANLDFDFSLDRAKSPRDAGNLAASITNLFYWNNVVHDVMQAHGFDEASGNFQYKNLTGQGLGNDFVRAEAQDGSGRNNANFSSPPDGTSGRMQMYLFDNTAANALTVTGSAAVAGAYRFASVAFGPRLTAKPLAGRLVLVNDGVSEDNGAHGCASPFVNAAAVSGNIAFIQRGGCPQLQLNPKATNAFATKVKRAQANGATGVIVFDSLATTNLVNFGGTDTVGIRIPAIFISGADGFRLRAAITGGAALAVAATLGPDIDGSFDSGVMSHEYGHGISNRLTGGRSKTNSCLPNTTGNQIGGEGWSDFFALWMTTKPGDIGSTNRYVGAYDFGQSVATGPGFRRKPYSTNFSSTGNNYTYAQLGTGTGQSSLTHDVGEVWCTMLWDLNWQLIYKYGYNPDFYALTGGNNIALKLVLDGCKLQPCNPSFLDARDAILSADAQSNGGANTALIWTVFARRGMGFGAKAGDVSAGVPQVTGVVESFTLPPGVTPVVLAARNGVSTASALEAYPNPAQDELLVRAPLASSTPVQVALLDALGRVVLRATGSGAVFQQAGVALRTAGLTNGVYVVRVTTSAGTYTTRVTVQH